MPTSYQDITFTISSTKAFVDTVLALLNAIGRSGADAKERHEKIQYYKKLQENVEKTGKTSRSAIEQVTKDCGKYMDVSRVANVETMKDLASYLERRNIRAVPFVRENDDGSREYAVGFSSADTKIAEKVIAQYNAEHARGAVSKSVMFNSTNDPRKVSDLSAAEALSFMKHSEKYHMPIYVEDNGKDKYTIVFDGHQRDKFDCVRAEVAYEFAGPAGKLYRDMYNYRNESQRLIIKAVEKAQSERKFIYIEDDRHTQLWLDREGMSIHYQKGDQRFFIETDSKQFHDSLKKILLGMHNPTLFTEEEYKAYREMDAEKAKEYKRELDRKHGRPELTKEGRALLERHEKERSLYEKKLLLERPGDSIHLQALSNDEERMATYNAFNRINVEHEHDESQPVADSASILDDAAYNYTHYVPEKDKRDFRREEDIEQYMEQIRSYELEKDPYDYDYDRDRDLGPESLDDIDANNILDSEEIDY